MEGNMASWNPWHGCHKLSEACRNCYVYRTDGKYGKDSSVVCKTKNFERPIAKDRKGNYKIPPGSKVWTCFSSDFFVKDADSWRPEAWKMIRSRPDLHFLMITKRIDRFRDCIPADWGDGYENVTICCTVENQDRADYRLPIYKKAPIKHKIIICEPLLDRIDLMKYLGDDIEQVVAGGESGKEARVCDYDWILDIREQCIQHHVNFWFKQTGSYLLIDDKIYNIRRHLQHSQARKSNLTIENKIIKPQLRLPMKYFYHYPTPVGEIFIMEEEDKITAVSLCVPQDKYAEKETPLIKKAHLQLDEYFAGKRKLFDLPLNPAGTDFQKRVWNNLCSIPFGETRTYKQLAELSGNPKAARAVGLANNRNPIMIVIPCHRVIGSNGQLTGYAAGLDMKEKLLQMEAKNNNP